MGDSETPSVAENRAIMNAKRIALEQAGTYVESYSKVENMQLAKDEIQVLAAGIVEVTVLEKKRTIVGDGLHIWVKIKARVKTDKIGEVAKRLQEKIIMDGYKKVLIAYEKSQTDIEQLKKQLAEAKTGKESNEIKKKIENDERLYKATQWYEKALKHMGNKEYDESLEAFTSVIALDPERYEAYLGRGNIFNFKKDYDRALKDYNHFINFLAHLPSEWVN